MHKMVFGHTYTVVTLTVLYLVMSLLLPYKGREHWEAITHTYEVEQAIREIETSVERKDTTPQTLLLVHEFAILTRDNPTQQDMVPLIDEHICYHRVAEVRSDADKLITEEKRLMKIRTDALDDWRQAIQTIRIILSAAILTSIGFMLFHLHRALK